MNVCLLIVHDNNIKMSWMICNECMSANSACKL